jgi:hypothetical protein
VALVYNGRSWYVRLAHPQARREAITSRPLLLSSVARLTQHAGQKRLLITLTHAAGDQIEAMLAAMRTGLDHVLELLHSYRTENAGALWCATSSTKYWPPKLLRHHRPRVREQSNRPLSGGNRGI